MQDNASQANVLSNKRDSHFDNAKFLLIFFVVLAHLFGGLRSSDVSVVSRLSTGIWDYFNTFHMAAFIFISGYFSKRFVKKGYSVQKPATYFILYLAAQAAFVICERYWWSDPAHVKITIFKAQGSLWFLQCMVIWYLLLPMLDQFKPKYLIAGSIVLALIAGYDIRVNDYLSFSRVLVHLPFFMTGYYTDKSVIEKLKSKKIIALSWVFMTVMFVLNVLLGKYIPPNILRCNTPYSGCSLSTPKYTWWLYRLAFYAIVFLMIFAFLAIVPKGKTFFSKWGSRTLAVYILHRFIFRSYEVYEWYRYFDKSITGMLLLCAAAAAITIILSLKPFSVPFELLQNIKITKILKEKEKDA